MSTKRIVTLVITFVLVMGGTAFAQEALSEAETEWQSVGDLFWWQYDSDTRSIMWGAEDCTPPAEESPELTAPVADTDTEEPKECRIVALGEEPDGDEPSPDPTDPDHPSQGEVISAFAKDVKAADEAGELEDGQNRGGLISALAKLNPFKDKDEDTELESEDPELKSDDDEDDDLEESESDDDEDGDEKPDKDRPEQSENGKAKGKDK